ncbi:MAG: hypothetical protein R3345_00845, partial [Fulvivirga sp.]|nr:hypothetical protein [Fulvivirga sp.]
MNTQLLLVGAGFINALILLIALSSLKGKIRKASRFLGWFIFGYFLTLANWVIIPTIASELNLLLPWIPFLFFIAPLGYFFFRAIDDPKFKVKGIFLILLIPGIVDIIYHLIQYFSVLLTTGADYRFLMNRGLPYFIHDGAAIVFTIICYAFILNFVFKLKHVEAPAKNFYLLFVVFMGYMIARWTTFYLVDLIRPVLLNNELFLGAWLLEMIGLLVVGYKGLVDSGMFNVTQKRLSTLNESELSLKSKELLELIKYEKLYLKSGLSRKELAEAMHTSEFNISHILNKGLE